MARALHKLSDRTVAAAKSAGRLSDGGNLYLAISDVGAKSWVFMWTPRGGKRREMGMGSYPTVSLAKARAMAASYRVDVSEGRDPIAVRDQTPEPTFGEAADAFIETIRSEWTNAKHAEQWEHTVKVRAAAIRGVRVSAIGPDHVLKVLRQPVTTKYRGVVKNGEFWLLMPETAGRVRNRIERILDYCRTKGWRSGENPARWKGHLAHLLPKPASLIRGHQPAMPYEEVPAFMAKLREQTGLTARAAEFTILNMSRSNEVLGAEWPEFNFEKRIWTVPAERMKMGEKHEVPLSDRAIEILNVLKSNGTNHRFVFPGQPRKSDGAERPLSNMSMLMLVRRMGYLITMHGFRSSARDWAGDETPFPREIVEHALAHKVGDSVEAAYRRMKALVKRKKLMQAWAAYCHPPAQTNVVPIGRKAAKA